MPTDIFLKITGIPGESKDDRHKDEIQVVSFSWGLSAQNPSPTGSGGGGGMGKTTVQALTFEHAVDRASPGLMKACATGQHLQEAMLSERRPGQGPADFLTIRMTDVVVTSVAMTGTAATTNSEVVSIAFGRVRYEYRAQKPDGSLDSPVTFDFDVRTNKIL